MNECLRFILPWTIMVVHTKFKFSYQTSRSVRSGERMPVRFGRKRWRVTPSWRDLR